MPTDIPTSYVLPNKYWLTIQYPVDMNIDLVKEREACSTVSCRTPQMKRKQVKTTCTKKQAEFLPQHHKARLTAPANKTDCSLFTCKIPMGWRTSIIIPFPQKDKATCMSDGRHWHRLQHEWHAVSGLQGELSPCRHELSDSFCSPLAFNLFTLCTPTAALPLTSQFSCTSL